MQLCYLLPMRLSISSRRVTTALVSTVCRHQSSTLPLPTARLMVDFSSGVSRITIPAERTTRFGFGGLPSFVFFAMFYFCDITELRQLWLNPTYAISFCGVFAVSFFGGSFR